MEPCCICMDNLSCVELRTQNLLLGMYKELSMNGYRECPLCRAEISKIKVCYNRNLKYLNN